MSGRARPERDGRARPSLRRRAAEAVIAGRRTASMSTGTSPSSVRAARRRRIAGPMPTRTTRGRGDPTLADACVQSLQAAGLPTLGVTFGATAAGSSTMPLDWGALDPAVVHARACRRREPSSCPLERRAHSGGRGPRGRDSSSPGRPDRERGPRPRPLGRRAVRLRTRVGRVRRRDPGCARQPAGRIARLGPRLRGRRKGGQLRQWLMLHGALGDDFEAELLSYEVPTPLRDAHRGLCSEGLTGRSAKCAVMARSKRPCTRPPRRRPAASRNGRYGSAAGKVASPAPRPPASRADRALPRRGRVCSSPPCSGSVSGAAALSLGPQRARSGLRLISHR